MKCPYCAFEVEYKLPKYSYNVGKVKEESGFQPILGAEGRLKWICSNCFRRVNKLAQEIYDIIQMKWVYLKSLLPPKEKKGDQND